MTDQRIREKERRAKMEGDDIALEAAQQANLRCRGRHGDKIGSWIIVETMQSHFCGQLLSVVECGGGVGIAQMHPCYWLSTTDVEHLTSDNVQKGDKPKSYPSSEDHPVDVYLSPATVVFLADASLVKMLDKK